VETNRACGRENVGEQRREHQLMGLAAARFSVSDKSWKKLARRNWLASFGNLPLGTIRAKRI
jgi:hypothetical protein